MKFYTDAELAQILDKNIFHRIGEVADELGVECYLVGGYVRDIFLERPTNDIDVVVVGSGIEVATALQHKLGKNPKTGRWRAHLAVYRNFGTAQVKFHDTEVEFVGARRESYDRSSRTTRTAATSPSTLWLYASITTASANWSTPSTAFTTLRTA